MSPQDAEAASDVVSGTAFLFGEPIYLLIDPGATHSFIAERVSSHVPVSLHALLHPLEVHTLLGQIVRVTHCYPECEISWDAGQIQADLVPIDVVGFDIILGMNYLSAYRAKVDCFRKEAVLSTEDGQKLVFVGQRQVVVSCLISAMVADRLLRQGCQAYLASVVLTDAVALELDDIPVATDFPDVFPEDLLGLPPQREIEFSIDTLPEAKPISIPP